MRAIPKRYSATRITRHGRVITPAHPEFGCATLIANGQADNSGSWVSANKPVAIPFRLSRSVVVTHLGWENGSSAGSNHDIGIYDRDWARRVSAGSTAGSGSSVWQFVDVTDTGLAAGDYYLVKVVDATTANRVRFFGDTLSVPLMALAGLQDSATNAFPLPDPLTDMAGAAVISRIPVVGFCVRAPL